MANTKHQLPVCRLRRVVRSAAGAARVVVDICPMRLNDATVETSERVGMRNRFIFFRFIFILEFLRLRRLGLSGVVVVVRVCMCVVSV